MLAEGLPAAGDWGVCVFGFANACTGGDLLDEWLLVEACARLAVVVISQDVDAGDQVYPPSALAGISSVDGFEYFIQQSLASGDHGAIIYVERCSEEVAVSSEVE